MIAIYLGVTISIATICGSVDQSSLPLACVDGGASRQLTGRQAPIDQFEQVLQRVPAVVRLPPKSPRRSHRWLVSFTHVPSCVQLGAVLTRQFTTAIKPSQYAEEIITGHTLGRNVTFIVNEPGEYTIAVHLLSYPVDAGCLDKDYTSALWSHGTAKFMTVQPSAWANESYPVVACRVVRIEWNILPLHEVSEKPRFKAVAGFEPAALPECSGTLAFHGRWLRPITTAAVLKECTPERLASGNTTGCPRWVPWACTLVSDTARIRTCTSTSSVLLIGDSTTAGIARALIRLVHSGRPPISVENWIRNHKHEPLNITSSWYFADSNNFPDWDRDQPRTLSGLTRRQAPNTALVLERALAGMHHPHSHNDFGALLAQLPATGRRAWDSVVVNSGMHDLRYLCQSTYREKLAAERWNMSCNAMMCTGADDSAILATWPNGIDRAVKEHLMTPALTCRACYEPLATYATAVAEMKAACRLRRS